MLTAANGYPCRKCGVGLTAIEVVNFMLAILDLGVPGGSGIEQFHSG
jgi:DNA-binding response OmpR family regulator